MAKGEKSFIAKARNGRKREKGWELEIALPETFTFLSRFRSPSRFRDERLFPLAASRFPRFRPDAVVGFQFAEWLVIHAHGYLHPGFGESIRARRQPGSGVAGHQPGA